MGPELEPGLPFEPQALQDLLVAGYDTFGLDAVGEIVVDASEPGGVHADVMGSRDIGALEVAHMTGFWRPDSESRECFGKYLCPGLGNTDLV